MKTCTKCNLNKPISDFSVKRGKPTSRCKSCNNEYFYKWYNKNKTTQSTRVMSQKKKRRKDSQDFLVEYLQNHPCVDCGISDILVLEFDHVKGKKRNVSRLLGEGCSVDRLKEELNLCEVRCCNCHRRKTLSRLGKHYRIV
jgi:hypothetical protein